MLIDTLLRNSAKAYPDKPAVLHNNAILTYAELEEKSNRSAHSLMDLGVAQGDRIALLLDNSIDWLVSYFGILKAGAVVVPLNSSLEDGDLRTILRDCTPILLIGPVSREHLFASLPGSVPELKGAICVDHQKTVGSGNYRVLKARGGDARPPSNFPTYSDLAAILYTSGSTGRPKGVMLTHANLVSNVDAIVNTLGLSSQDATVVLLPLFYSSGMSQMLCHIRVGGKMVLARSAFFPNVIWRIVQDENITGLSGVPTLFAMLLSASNLQVYRLESLRYLMSAGARMPPNLIRALLKALPGVDVYSCYGLTEASPRVTYLHPRHILRKITSVGKAIPGVEVRIVDEDGREITSGEVGEVVVKGPNVMKGYWGMPRQTAKVLRPDGLHTGDLGTIDEEGYITLMGRKSEIIKKGGKKLLLAEIEAVLLQHDRVQEAAVVAMPDETWSEVPGAFVVLRERESVVTEAELLKHCYANLEPFKVPGRIHICSSLPRTASGKVKKELLGNLAIECVYAKQGH